MTATIDLCVPCPDWLARLPDAGPRAAAAARGVLAQAALFLDRLGPALEVSIVLGDDALVRRLNRQRRGQDRNTDVLSFPTFDREALREAAEAGQPGPAPGGPLLLGDVVLAFETVAAAAAARDLALADHLAHLVVHGVLHLLGHDHQDPAEARTMAALESRVLAGLGIADPWTDPWTDPGAETMLGAGVRS